MEKDVGNAEKRCHLSPTLGDKLSDGHSTATVVCTKCGKRVKSLKGHGCKEKVELRFVEQYTAWVPEEVESPESPKGDAT